MFKKALTVILLAGFWLFSAFTARTSGETWTATIQLEGKSKPITLVSEAVYGGYNSVEKKIFLFGKNHMFQNKADNSNAQIFRDLCTTNASGQFQFELNSVNSEVAPATPKMHNGNISFKKKHLIAGTIQQIKSGTQSGKKIVVKGDFKELGLQMTDEANQIMTGKFTLTFTSKN